MIELVFKQLRQSLDTFDEFAPGSDPERGHAHFQSVKAQLDLTVKFFSLTMDKDFETNQGFVSILSLIHVRTEHLHLSCVVCLYGIRLIALFFNHS